MLLSAYNAATRSQLVSINCLKLAKSSRRLTTGYFMKSDDFQVIDLAVADANAIHSTSYQHENFFTVSYTGLQYKCHEFVNN